MINLLFTLIFMLNAEVRASSVRSSEGSVSRQLITDRGSFKCNESSHSYEQKAFHQRINHFDSNDMRVF